MAGRGPLVLLWILGASVHPGARALADTPASKGIETGDLDRSALPCSDF